MVLVQRNAVASSPLRSPRIERKRQARRAAILRAAMEVVSRAGVGVEGLTLQAIADALDYSPGALYRYFPSKDVLVAELQRSVIRVLGEKVDELWERCDALLRGGPGRRATVCKEGVGELLPLVALPFLYDHVAARVPEQFGMLSNSVSDPRPLIDDGEARLVFADARPIFERIAERFDAATRAGALASGDSLQRALVLWASMQGVVQLRKLRRIDPDLLETEALLASLAEALFRGWGAKASALNPALRLARRADFAAVPVVSEDFASAPRNTENNTLEDE